MQTLHRKHPEQRFGVELITRRNQNKMQSKLIRNKKNWLKSLLFGFWQLQYRSLYLRPSVAFEISEWRSTLLLKHRLNLITPHISCSAGRCGNVFGTCQESRSIYLGSPCINPSPSWSSVSPLAGRKKKESLAPPCSEWKMLPLNLATGFQAQFSFFGAFVTKQMWCLWKKD